ncbi:MAG: CHAT domain-containing protein [Nitrospinae bacterium]|nr:CHAT domain-containing protein [Nitrospinota bacterium]
MKTRYHINSFKLKVGICLIAAFFASTMLTPSNTYGNASDAKELEKMIGQANSYKYSGKLIEYERELKSTIDKANKSDRNDKNIIKQKGRALDRLGTLYKKRNDFSLAEKNYIEARDCYEKSGYKYGKNVINYNLITLAIKQMNWGVVDKRIKTALKDIEEYIHGLQGNALVKAQGMKVKILTVNSIYLSHIGQLYNSNMQLVEATKLSDEINEYSLENSTLEDYEKINLLMAPYNSYYLQAELAFEMGRPQDFEDYMYYMIEQKNKIKEIKGGIDNSYFISQDSELFFLEGRYNLSNAINNRYDGSVELAIEKLKGAIKGFGQTGDKGALRSVYLNLGIAYLIDYKFTEAEQFLKELNNPLFEAVYYMRRGSHEKKVDLLKKSLTIAKKIEMDMQAGNIALTPLESTVLYMLLGSSYQYIAILEDGKIDRNNKNVKDALDSLHKARDLRNQLAEGLTIDQLAGIGHMITYGFKLMDIDFDISSLETDPLASLASYLNGKKTGFAGTICNMVRKRVEESGKEINDLYEKIENLRHKNTPNSTNEIKAIIKNIESLDPKLARMLESGFSSYVAQSSEDFKRVLSNVPLKEKETYIVTSINEKSDIIDQYVAPRIWFIKKGGEVKSTRVNIEKAQFADKITIQKDISNVGDEEGFIKSGYFLFENLYKDTYSFLYDNEDILEGNNTLIFNDDRSLNGVPLHLLPVNQDPSEPVFLIEKVSVARSFSLEAFIHSSKYARNDKTKDTLIGASPINKKVKEFEALDDLDKAINEGKYLNLKVDERFGENFTKRAINSALKGKVSDRSKCNRYGFCPGFESNEYRYIVLGTHAFLGGTKLCHHPKDGGWVKCSPADKPYLLNETSLLFSDDNLKDRSGYEDWFMGSSEVLNFDLNAELVMLMACNTGTGGEDGVGSLAWSFNLAGAAALLSTNHEVYSDYSVEFVSDILSELNEGNSTAFSIYNDIIRKKIKNGGSKTDKHNLDNWSGYSYYGFIN